METYRIVILTIILSYVLSVLMIKILHHIHMLKMEKYGFIVYINNHKIVYYSKVELVLDEYDNGTFKRVYGNILGNIKNEDGYDTVLIRKEGDDKLSWIYECDIVDFRIIRLGRG